MRGEIFVRLAARKHGGQMDWGFEIPVNDAEAILLLEKITPRSVPRGGGSIYAWERGSRSQDRRYAFLNTV